jgi:methyltransferase (TIGR00027 family)
MTVNDASTIRDVSDTALWVAVYRARETDRPDARFRDPFARRLAGERGERIAASQPFFNRAQWSFVARTFLFDRFIAEEVARGADMVVNLAAGLDARPYRMDLPLSLQWVEVDLPAMLAHKEAVLHGETPRCALERVALDLRDVAGRRSLFGRLAARARRAIILCEGLLIYLEPEDVIALGTELASRATFDRWIVDIGSPALKRLLEKKVGKDLGAAGAPFRFAPEDGPEFFRRCGWKAADVRSILGTAAKLKRLPPLFRLVAALAGPNPGFKANRPWSAVCSLEKVAQ